jgi:hypothetical protein
MPPRAPINLVRIAAFIAAAALSLAAEDAPKSRSQLVAERQKLYPELVRIVEFARGVPPEFAAEALLRVAEAPFLIDRDWKRELIDEAFQNASHAREPLSKRNAIGSLIAGTRASMIAQAGALGLDRLALQMRAVRDELAFDPAKARDMFATAGKPVPARTSCEDTVIDNVSPYFETLVRITDSGFTAEEEAKDVHVQSMAAELKKMTSPVEIGPAARAIVALPLRPPELEVLVTAFAGAVQKISGDDRSFSASVATTDRDIEALARKVSDSGISTEALTSAYRQYLTQNLSGARCEDTVANPPTDVTLLGIDPASMKPSKVSGKPKLDRFVNSDQSNRFRKQFNELMFGDGSRGLTDEQKRTPQWREKFTAVVNSIDEMKRASGESAADFFYQKSGAYTLALMAAPPGPDRDRIVPQYIAFLRGTDMANENAIGWFTQVEALAAQTLSMSVDEHGKLLAALAASGHPVLRLYAEEAMFVPQRPTWAR